MKNYNFKFMCSYSGKPISFEWLKSVSSVMVWNGNKFFIEEKSKPDQVLTYFSTEYLRKQAWFYKELN